MPNDNDLVLIAYIDPGTGRTRKPTVAELKEYKAKTELESHLDPEKLSQAFADKLALDELTN